MVAVGAIFTLARFSEAFLGLRAQQVGFAIEWVPLVMIVMSLSYSISAYPAGILSDRVNRRYLLAAGIVLLILADLVLAWAGSPLSVLLGVALWGAGMGCTQGILAAMIAEVTPPELKGTAFGLFNLASGLFMLLASVIAGGLWDRYGPAITFYVGAAFSLSAFVMLTTLAKRRQPRQRHKCNLQPVSLALPPTNSAQKQTMEGTLGRRYVAEKLPQGWGVKLCARSIFGLVNS